MYSKVLLIATLGAVHHSVFHLLMTPLLMASKLNLSATVKCNLPMACVRRDLSSSCSGHGIRLLGQFEVLCYCSKHMLYASPQHCTVLVLEKATSTSLADVPLQRAAARCRAAWHGRDPRI